jgi:hypothetical protein
MWSTRGRPPTGPSSAPAFRPTRVHGVGEAAEVLLLAGVRAAPIVLARSVAPSCLVALVLGRKGFAWYGHVGDWLVGRTMVGARKPAGDGPGSRTSSCKTWE